MRFNIVFIILFFSQNAFTQIGGTRSFQFLTIPYHARVASSGGNAVSLNNESAFLLNNPAIYSEKFHKEITLSYLNYIYNINGGFFQYNHLIEKVGLFSIGSAYMNYGSFERTNILGEKQGNFSASDLLFYLTYSKPVNSLVSIGANMKHIYAAYDNIYSYAIAFDLGVFYTAENQLTSAGLAINNIGHQIKGFYDKNYVKLPFNISMGISQKLGQAPLRFTFTADNLQKWNLLYDDGTLTQEQLQKNNEHLITFEKVLRHLTANMEFVPSEAFFAQISYHYRRRKELKYNIVTTGLAGFGIGAGINISKFTISYARNIYNSSGASNTLSISTNISKFTATKTIKN